MNEQPSAPELPPAPVQRNPDEIEWDLLATFRQLIAGFWLLLLTTALGLAVGLLLAFHAKPFYIAKAIFLPPKSADILNPAPTSLFGGSDGSDLYLGLLQSRSIQDDVIDHVGLMSIYKVDKRVDAESMLAGSSSFSVSKNSLIEVNVRANDPKLAPVIANAYLEALYRLNGQMVASGSLHRRGFFEAQLEEQRKSLEQAETELKKTEERTGVVLPAGEAQAAINATAGLQAQIGAAEAKLAGLLTGETENNPEVVQARNEIAQLNSQLAQQQASGTGRGIASNGRMPELTLEVSQKTREVRLRETVYDALVQQYERARLSSIDPGPQLQIVDLAVVPERKAGPSRKTFAVVGFLAGLIAGLAYILGAKPLRRLIFLLREPVAGAAS